MGHFFSTVFGKLFGKKDVRILMLGLNNAGKTTILYKMNLGDFIKVAPSKLSLSSDCLQRGDCRAQKHYFQGLGLGWPERHQAVLAELLQRHEIGHICDRCYRP